MIYLQDSDFTLHQGDALEVLRTLPDESVHMCVTSPPFYGLRNYGVDGQIGLEETPEQWVQKLVEVFREVRRVLRRDGTLWLEVGDSYNSRLDGSHGGWDSAQTDKATSKRLGGMEGRPGRYVTGCKPKDLIGAPWLLAFALRADGWFLRSDIVWSRPNPMPESVTDRPTKSHSYVFLLSKSARYFFDQEAVREPWTGAAEGGKVTRKRNSGGRTDGYTVASGTVGRIDAGRNIRSVWNIATQPYPEAHFATYPEELVRRCILAGTSERGCCSECGAPWVREVEREPNPGGISGIPGEPYSETIQRGKKFTGNAVFRHAEIRGWLPSCECGWSEPPYEDERPYSPIPCTVLDPFSGSGTTGLVARKHGRRSIGIELSANYCALTARRLQQLSLLSEAGA